MMAQKFTVDPRLVQGASGPVTDMNDDSESEDEELTAEEKKARERVALRERLAKEYEDSVIAAKAAAASGEGCTMCSS